jgi:imidazolonepropionase-like amidohydrolase
VLGHYILAAAGKRIIESGFTTVRDVGSHDDEASALKLAVDMGIVPGPRILTCGRAALGRSDLGRISVGATADLVVFNGRPDVELGLLTQPSSIVEVMRSGAAVG